MILGIVLKPILEILKIEYNREYSSQLIVGHIPNLVTILFDWVHKPQPCKVEQAKHTSRHGSQTSQKGSAIQASQTQVNRAKGTQFKTKYSI